MEQRLIRSLLKDKKDGTFEYGKKEDESLWSSAAIINRIFKTNLSVDDVRSRLKFLKERYEAFRELLSYPDVDFDWSINHVLAPDFVWKDICKKIPLTRAYKLCGEAKWLSMDTIFKLQCPEPKPNTKTVILLSSDDESEVNSPFRRIVQSPNQIQGKDKGKQFASSHRVPFKRMTFRLDEEDHPISFDFGELPDDNASSSLFPLLNYGTKLPLPPDPPFKSALESCASFSPTKK